MLIKKPFKIVATILARNEEDIIGQNIEHHIEQGVSEFIITDNNSSDKTKSIVEKYSEVKELFEELDDTHQQAKHVTKMARAACKMNPDWIIHLDADELWGGLDALKCLDANAFASEKMFLHPPCGLHWSEMCYYLDFGDSFPEECKIGHRPDPEIMIAHGNHGFEKTVKTHFTKKIWRHHFPIRSYEQLARKAREGHLSLLRRNTVCKRWQNWYNSLLCNRLHEEYAAVCKAWSHMVASPNHSDFMALLDFWATPEMQNYFATTKTLPEVKEWKKCGRK